MTGFVIPPPAAPALAVAGSDQRVPAAPRVLRRPQLRRPRARDGHRSRTASRRSSSPSRPTPSCRPAATVPYPSATRDLHHEVELVVALKAGRREHRAGQGAGPRVGLRRRPGPDAPRPAGRRQEDGPPVGHGQGLRRVRAVQPARPGRGGSGHPSNARIWLEVNGAAQAGRQPERDDLAGGRRDRAPVAPRRRWRRAT